MSEAQEIALGQESDAADPPGDGRLRRPRAAALRQRHRPAARQAVASGPSLPWQFTVVDQPAINAFALPGGFIYVTRGILPYLDDEARARGRARTRDRPRHRAPLGAAVHARRSAAQLGLAALGVFVPAARPFGQSSQQALGAALPEVRPRRRAAVRSARARATRPTDGWDPRGVPGMLSTLGRLDEASGDRKGVPNFLSTHPDPLARVAGDPPTVQQARPGGATSSPTATR